MIIGQPQVTLLRSQLQTVLNLYRAEAYSKLDHELPKGKTAKEAMEDIDAVVAAHMKAFDTTTSNPIFDVKIVAVEHDYSCGGYWIGREDNKGKIRCVSGNAVLTKHQATQRLESAKSDSPDLIVEWRKPA